MPATKKTSKKAAIKKTSPTGPKRDEDRRKTKDQLIAELHNLRKQTSKLKKDQGALKEAKRKYSALMDEINDGFYIINTEGIVTYANNAILKLHGVEGRDEVVGNHFVQFVAPEARDLLFKMFKEGMASGASPDLLEFPIVKKDGSFGFVQVKPHPIFEKGRVVGSSGLIRDITDRKIAEMALRESEEKYRSLADNNKDAILTCDAKDNITYANPACLEVFGYTQAEFRNMPGMAEKIVHPDYLGKFIKFWEGYSAKKVFPEKPFEMAWIRKDGKTVYTENTFTNLCDYFGNVTGFQIIARDITERRKAGAEVKKSLREKELLLKEIHHRVKNNMAVISSMLSLQSRRIKDAGAAEVFRNCQNRIRSMALVHEKLYQSKDIAKIEFLDYTRGLVKELVQSHDISRRKVAVIVEGDGAFMDVDTIIPCGLIITELATNSLKYAFEGVKNPEIRISLRIGNGVAALNVGDNGPGLPPDFDYCDSKSLGCQIVHTLVRQLKGTMEFDKGGEGTVCRVSFKWPRTN